MLYNILRLNDLVLPRIRFIAIHVVDTEEELNLLCAKTWNGLSLSVSNFATHMRANGKYTLKLTYSYNGQQSIHEACKDGK
jgi:hypothetical protein